MKIVSKIAIEILRDWTLSDLRSALVFRLTRFLRRRSTRAGKSITFGLLPLRSPRRQIFPQTVFENQSLDFPRLRDAIGLVVSRAIFVSVFINLNQVDVLVTEFNFKLVTRSQSHCLSVS